MGYFIYQIAVVPNRLIESYSFMKDIRTDVFDKINSQKLDYVYFGPKLNWLNFFPSYNCPDIGFWKADDTVGDTLPCLKNLLLLGEYRGNDFDLAIIPGCMVNSQG